MFKILNSFAADLKWVVASLASYLLQTLQNSATFAAKKMSGITVQQVLANEMVMFFPLIKTITSHSCEATFHNTPTFNMAYTSFYMKGYFPFFCNSRYIYRKTDCIQIHYAPPPRCTKSCKTRNILHTFTIYRVYLGYYKLGNCKRSQISLRNVIVVFHINNFQTFSSHQFE